AMTEPSGKTSTRLRLARLSPDATEPPPALPRFEHVTRYWDTEHACYSARLLPGEYYVTCHSEAICTVLGSCVSACVRDTRQRRRHEPFHAAARWLQRREHLGRGGERRHPLRQRGDGAPDQRDPETRRST